MGVIFSDSENRDKFYESERIYKELNELLELAEEISTRNELLKANYTHKKMIFKINSILFLSSSLSILPLMLFYYNEYLYSLYGYMAIGISIAIVYCALALIFYIYFLKSKNEINSMIFEIKFQQENISGLINSINELFHYSKKREILSPYEIYKLKFKLDMLNFKAFH
jgi:hypothetical protein